MQTSILRDKVKHHLLNEIQQGKLEIGKTINLAALARKIGISVTPIREALSQLEQARIIKAIPNRGFVVSKLDSNEAKSLYGTIAQLETMALESSNFTEDVINALQMQLQRLTKANSAAERLQTRFEFNSLLAQQCGNAILLQILDDLRARLLFYEHGLAEDSDFYKNIVHQNQSVLSAIQENNLPTAALILKMNWMSVLEYVEKQI